MSLTKVSFSMLSGASANVLDFGADPTGASNSTAAIQAAVDSVSTSGGEVFFPAGVYVTDEITSTTAKPIIIRGVGRSVYTGTATQTSLIKARSVSQAHVFGYTGGSGITFQDLAIDANSLSNYGILCDSPGLICSNVTVYGSLLYGIYAKALAHLDNVFVRDNTAVGCSISSDGSIENSEFTGGTIPLEIRGGGNTISGVLANSGTESCIFVTKETGKSNINTRFVGCYIGEVLSGAVSKPIVNIVGDSGSNIQEVSFSGCYFVSAVTNPSTNINGFVYAEYVKGLTFASCNFRGLGSGATGSGYNDYGIYGNNCIGLVVSSSFFRDINKNPIRIAGASSFVVSGVEFRDCGAQIATGTAMAMIRVDTSSIRGNVVGNSFQQTVSSGPYFMYGGDSTLINVSENYLRGGDGTQDWTPATGTAKGRFFRDSATDYERAVTFKQDASANIASNSLFVDSADNLLKFRDNSGTVRVVTVV